MSVGKFCTKRTDRCARSRRKVVSCTTKKLEKYWWAEFETTTNCNAGSNEETSWHLCTWVAPVEAQVNMRDTLRQDAEILMDVQPH